MSHCPHTLGPHSKFCLIALISQDAQLLASATAFLLIYARVNKLGRRDQSHTSHCHATVVGDTSAQTLAGQQFFFPDTTLCDLSPTCPDESVFEVEWKDEAVVSALVSTEELRPIISV